MTLPKICFNLIWQGLTYKAQISRKAALGNFELIFNIFFLLINIFIINKKFIINIHNLKWINFKKWEKILNYHKD